jgi:hypothetical protein
MSFARLRYLLALLVFITLLGCSLEDLFKTCPSEMVNVNGNCIQPVSTYAPLGSPCPTNRHRDDSGNCVLN